MKSFEERVADKLLSAGLLTVEQLTEVQELQTKQGGRILKLLRERNLVTEQDLMVSMGQCLNTSPVTLAKMHVPPEILELVPPEMAQTHKMVAVARLGQIGDRVIIMAFGWMDDEEARSRKPAIIYMDDGNRPHQ